MHKRTYDSLADEYGVSKDCEGWGIKQDYTKQHMRFRSYWSEGGLRTALIDGGFDIVGLAWSSDPFGKVWMDFVMRKKG